MKWLAVALALAPACFNPKFDNPTCGPNGECPSGSSCVSGVCSVESSDDAGPDIDGEAASDARVDVMLNYCQGSGAWEVCVGTTPTATVSLSSSTIDTGTSTLCQAGAGFITPGQPDACVIAGSDIAITGTVSVRGTRPLVLLASGTIAIGSASVLDVGSHRPGTVNAGAGAGNPSSGCNAFAAVPGADGNGGGGGAGGSFMTIGGNGGLGGKSGAQAGLAAPTLSAPATLRAGCPGQVSGGGVIMAGGPGGLGGGAVFLLATTITVAGSINASGSGGVGAPSAAGGGGGGSGGMIVLDATTFTGTTAGKIAANAGGGAGGAGSSAGSAGDDGAVGTLLTPAAGGGGGGGNTCQTIATGGNGFAGTTAATTGIAGSSGGACGGGGGGGGGGYIRSNVAVGSVMTSPAVTIIP